MAQSREQKGPECDKDLLAAGSGNHTDEMAGDLLARGSATGYGEAVPELCPEATDAVCLAGTAEERGPFLWGIETEDHTEENGQEEIAQVEHQISDPDPVYGEEEPDLDLTESDWRRLVNEGQTAAEKRLTRGGEILRCKAKVERD